ncbi:ER lumen protein-retaining receptor [Mycena venus]|uniref:ER lumen protein-retaining receptor n=1 Tax=Mycena venus TaxID=2733690 RepID=A0A8H7DAF3_9AGAR|nr:ER lumen protein-retaining receptor [Mycena venus]
MKRGFLNSSKAKVRPLGPELVSAPILAVEKPAISSLEEPFQSMKFPIGKVEKLDLPESSSSLKFVERDPRSGSMPGAMTYTTFPFGAADNEPVTECFFFSGSKEVLMNKGPGFPKPLVHPATPAFTMKAVPGKGMGLFSTRALKMGELILSERPLLITARGVPTGLIPGYTREMFLQHSLAELEKCVAIAVNRMRPENKAAFMALANCHTEDGSGPVVGIIRTNGLGIEGLRPGATDETRRYSAIPKDISRLNHSCSPNTTPRFDLDSFGYQLRAVRSITAGEELTFQYVDVGCSAAERNEALKPYAFVCACPACTDAPASDARRAAIKAYNPSVLLWAIDRKLSDDSLINECLEQLARLTTEGLEHHGAYFDATKAIMEAYICLGDTQNASKWTAKVHKQVWAHRYEKEISEFRLSELLDPANTAAYEKHPFWRMRVDPNPTTAMYQTLAALAGPNNIKTLPGGQTFMMFPGPPL